MQTARIMTAGSLRMRAYIMSGDKGESAILCKHSKREDVDFKIPTVPPFYTVKYLGEVHSFYSPVG